MENKTHCINQQKLLLKLPEIVQCAEVTSPELIPRQLQHPEFQFILIPRCSKAPCEKNWTATNNYRFDDPKLIAWIKQGGNYGICCGFGNLVGIDADDPITSEIFERHFGPTFRVRSGSGRGFHDYTIVRGMPGKQILIGS